MPARPLTPHSRVTRAFRGTPALWWCALLSGLLLLPAATALGAVTYGQATLAKGKMIVLRDGGRRVYRGAGVRVAILHGDVIRLGPRSNVVLETVEKSTVTLGGNAVFQVKPWRRREKRGLLRMLFGRFRAKIARLSGGERFNVSTATATIGVKGTEYIAAVPPQGDVLLLVTESVVQLAGPDGVEQNVPQGSISVVINGQPAKAPVPAPPAVLSILAQEGLDAPSPNDPAALELPAQEVLIEAGIVTRPEAEASSGGAEQSGPDAPQPTPTSPKAEAADPSAPVETTDATDATDAETAPASPEPPEPTFPDTAEDVLDSIEQTTQESAQEAGGPQTPLRLRFER